MGVGSGSVKAADAVDRLYLDLKGAWERLCRSQVGLPATHGRMLGEAIERVDSVGAYHCPQWSRFDQPEVPEP